VPKAKRAAARPAQTNGAPEGERPCPVCGWPMDTARVYGVSIDFCPQHGVWTDKGELPAIRHRIQATQEVRAARGAGRPDEDKVPASLRALRFAAEDETGCPVPEGQRPCPICRRPMAVETQHGVKVDLCPDHGVWLDRDELRDIKRKVYELELRVRRAEPEPTVTLAVEGWRIAGSGFLVLLILRLLLLIFTGD